MTVASEMATVESKLDIDGLEEGERYAALTARYEQLWVEFDVDAPEEDPYLKFTSERVRSLLE